MQLYMCVSTWLCMHMPLCEYAHAHVETQGQCQKSSSINLTHCNRVYQSNTELTNMTTLARQLALGIPYLSAKAGITGGLPKPPHIYRSARDLNCSLHTFRASTLTTEPFPQAQHCYFKKINKSWKMFPMCRHMCINLVDTASFFFSGCWTLSNSQAIMCVAGFLYSINF